MIRNSLEPACWKWWSFNEINEGKVWFAVHDSIRDEKNHSPILHMLSYDEDDGMVVKSLEEFGEGDKSMMDELSPELVQILNRHFGTDWHGLDEDAEL